MRITNNADLPEPLARAVSFDGYDHQPGTYSATALVAPPRIRVLRERHDDDIEVDVSDLIWRSYGSAMHALMEHAGADDALQEERLSMPVGGAVVTGKPDLYTSAGVLWDFKTTSVWSVIDGTVKPEWEAQLNIYAALLRHHGFPVREVRIAAILRDWSAGKAKGGDNYPRQAAQVLPVTLWPDDLAQAYVEARVALHLQSDTFDDDVLPVCGAEERWQDPSRFAVMKPGRKSAVRLLDTSPEAESMAFTLGGGHHVVERPSEPRRCQDYCDVAPWCNWYQTWLIEHQTGEV